MSHEDLFADGCHPHAGCAPEADADARLGGPGPDVCIIVPTRNEAGNVASLVARLDAALGSARAEILFVDDSTDDTPQVISDVARESARVVRLLHRPAGQRGDGLGGAVAAGLDAARAPWVCVMDGDLQHPPEVVPQLLERASTGDVDLVVASRFCASARVEGLGRLRRAVSHSLIGLARGLFPRTLRGVSDPLTGFFLVRRDALVTANLRPRGFKILLEILVRTPGLRVAEVPFTFGERHSGESKACLGEAVTYVTQLGRLRIAAGGGRAARFALVGLSGVLVNTALLAAFTESFGIYYVLSAVLATQGSSLWNFALTERWVFRDRRLAGSPGRRLVLFLGMNNLALVVRGPLLLLLTAGGLHYLLANVLSLVGLVVARFAIADGLIWRGPSRTRPAACLYSIHGIVTLASEVALPELARFAVDELSKPPTITVRIGRVDHATAGARERLSVVGSRLVYREGPLGFGMDIRMGPPIEVVASPLLRHSPHVLYTNVVEPVLRWTFVEQGHALVHSACVAFDGHAFLVTARTDTGKTTTILRTLDSHPCGFVSDDLTLLTPDGRVLTYPKPLTISSHTVGAVRTPLLRRHERAFLPIQSRLHSRSGRRAGLAIARSALPAATMNAIVQALIPPPKYHVDRLVHGVEFVREARLAGLVVIERDGDEALPLSAFESLETLMRNCDDAYTFPPYPLIEGFLHSRDGADLRTAERAIVAAALVGVPGVLLRSERREWASQIPLVAAEAALSRRRSGKPQPANGNGRAAASYAPGGTVSEQSAPE